MQKVLEINQNVILSRRRRISGHPEGAVKNIKNGEETTAFYSFFFIL